MLLNRFLNRSYLANLLYGLVAAPAVPMPDPMRAPYDDYLPEELQKLLYSYDQLLARAGDRTTHLFTIPHLGDYNRSQLRSGDVRLPVALCACASWRPRLHYTGLLPAFEATAKNSDAFNSFFLACDGHWNNRGHALATQAVLQALEPRLNAVRRQ